mmetsp:Transcript_58622/g.137173  ORF Transcript_58622/g.137173 Transcript_58622/m.137173 type:complete len:178 (+) Transcript_58622:82-615(+)
MPLRVLDQRSVKEYFPSEKKFAQVLRERPEMDLYYLCSIGKSHSRLEKCLKTQVDVNKPNEMGATAVMFAARAWSPSFVERLIEAKANVNAEDRYGATALDMVNDDVRLFEDQKRFEQVDCRRRRLAMEVSGQILFDRPNVEDLEPFCEMDQLYKVKSVLEAAGARPGENRFRPGYD